MKKLLSIILCVAFALTVCFALASCGEKAKYRIGVCQLAPHVALDAATKGFVDALKEAFGDDVEIDLQNAASDSPTCTTIVNSFVSKNYDLIMANATPAVQAAANATTTIPILGTSVTEYGVALSLDNFSGVTGMNVSGTSDLAPLTEQAQMIIDLFPDATKIGLLFCSAEANSKYQVDVVKAYLESNGKTATFFTFSDTNDIQSVMTSACSACDVIYVPTDNTAATCASTINAISRETKTPVFAGEEGICEGCGTFTLSISYYEIGHKTGEMAVQILRNGADVSKMKIEYDPNPVKKYNKTNCEFFGITVPSDYVAIGG